MNIPDEAVEAATQALRDAFDWGVGGCTFAEQARRALEAAARHLEEAIVEDLARQSEELDDDGLTSLWIRTRKLTYGKKPA